MINEDLLGLINRNLLKSILYSKRYGRRIIIKNKSKLYIDKTAKINIGGTLEIGKIWPHTAYKTTSFVVEKNASFINKNYLEVISGSYIKVSEGAHLEIGGGVINQNANIQCYHSIIMGEDMAISENVTIRDTDNHFIIQDGKKHNNTAPIRIGNHVWIGLGVTILKGVSIGDNVIIAANSLVTHDIPSNSLAAGSPARVVKTNVTWSWA